MGDSPLAKALKDLPLKLQSASLKERRQLFHDLQDVFTNQDIDEAKVEAVVKGVCKLLLLTLPRYCDQGSRSLVGGLIIALCQKQHEATLKNLPSILNDYASSVKNVASSNNTGREMLTLFKWTTLLLVYGFKESARCVGENFKQLIHAQAVFLSQIAATGNAKILNKAIHSLTRTCKAIPGLSVAYWDVLSSSEPSYFTVVLGSSLLGIADSGLRDKMVPVLLDGFIKSSVTTKTKPPQFVLDASRPLLKRLTHDHFQSLLLPALQKAMLRSPEIILDCIGRVLGGVSLDLSRYTGDLGKSLATNLHSKEDLSREEAIRAVEALARQCSEATSVKGLLDLFFAVLQGSEGKLTVTSHKMSVLQGVGKLSLHCVTGAAAQQLSAAAADHFVKVLETEVHEGTLVEALQMLTLWASRLSTDMPKSLLQIFKNGMTLKTSTAAVRTAYIHCIGATLHGDLISKAAELVPTLVKCVERAAAQPTQAAVVNEGLAAVALMIRLGSSDVELETKCNAVVPVALDMDKQLFLNDKFLAACGDEGLQQVALYCEQLLTTSPYKVSKTGPLYRGLVVALLRPNFAARTRVAASIKRVLSSEGGASHSVALCRELTHFLLTAKMIQREETAENATAAAAAPSAINEIPVHSLINCLEKITDVKTPSDDVAVACFKAAHFPAIVAIRPDQWELILRHWGEKPYDLVLRCYEQLKELIIDSYTPSSWNEAVIEGLVRLAAEKAIPDVMAYVKDRLGDPELLKVTRDDYFVSLTPEGSLYDRSVIDNIKEDQGRNLKRESRVYSYKEQMEEMQLRRELEEKKKREGKWKEPEYTPKQKEAIKQQLDKESAVRARVSGLVKKVESAASMLTASVRGNPYTMAFHFTQIIREVLRAFSSPAAAPSLTKVWLELRSLAVPRDAEILGQSIGHVTLRLLKPQCDLDSAWEAEDLAAATQRIVQLLLNQVPPSSMLFNYSFPLIRAAVQMAGTQNEELVTHCVELLQQQAQVRDTDEDGHQTAVNNPRYLPLRDIIDILIRIISTWTGRVQQQACAALGDVAAAISGAAGCAVATDDEITCLLDGLENAIDSVRDTCLMALNTLLPVLPLTGDTPLSRRLIRRLWVAKFDVVPETREMGESTWTEAEITLDKSICSYLLEDVTHMQEPIRSAAAEALASALQLFASELPAVLQELLKLYEEKLVMAPPVLDNFGRVLEPALDIWQPRAGIGLAFAKIAPLFGLSSVSKLAQFFVQKGLGDRDECVRKNMLEAAVAVVDLHGKEAISDLLPVFERFMDEAPKSGSFDSVRQSVIVLMGSLARHLDKEDPRVKPIFMKLVDALSTPSQQVQEAVANCLPPLAPAIKEEAGPLTQKLLAKLLDSDNYGERKGAAYGIAGIVKGLGILTLKQLDIMTNLTDAIQDKKNFRHREGALFAFEQLSNMLGRLFEPYIVHVLPHLLLCFGDSNQYVREAADDTAKAVMSKLSAHGVKLVLPSLLNALEQDSWRTKTGSVELLGAMAYCAPRQLSSCLPSIVPKLIEVLGDSHVKVQAAGAQALQMIGSVIRNPEIQAIVPVLLGALQDPAKKTSPCLATLLDTKFVHFIDAPSLALIMPVVQRAFQDRSTETRKMAAQIIGNMYSLTDQKDLSPYLPTIIPGLKASLLDPVPEVRSVSSRALGAMVRGMGESSFEDLLPWLMQTLTSETSSVDRSGAAQGLSEVVGGLGVDKLHKLMPEIIATAERIDIAPHVKDGYIMMFIYMPVVFQNEFTQYISQIIPPILKALADENEFVRETALRAGQRIVNMYAETAIMLLLPELERGLLDDNWRIRFSSVQLLGDLLYKISGVSGKMTTETANEDDNFGTEQSHRAILDTLGAERRNKVLSGLYMGRSDVALLVRQAALHVWKVVVTNTPRTLREILPTLFGLLLGCLASTSFDKRQVAARTLGDLVRKLGERVLPEIIPILEKGLESEQADQRQGVCIGLSEIMASTSREMILTFVDSLVPTIRKALCDPLEEVRQAAARTFDSLHSTVGSRALDDILPFMLEQLNDDSVHDFALDGLRQVMAIKSRVVLPYLIPQLTAPPINTKALSVLASVAGEALARHFSRLLPALLSAVTAAAGTPTENQELEYCRIVLLAVQDDQGVRVIMDELIAASKSDKVAVRRAAVALLAGFCADTKLDYTQYVPQLLRGLIHLLIDTDPSVLSRTWDALNAVIKTLDASQQLAHVGELKQAVRFAVSDLKGQELLPGFCLPKGIAPLLPIYREAILNGAPDLKELAAQGLGELIKLTSPEALKPSVVNITGPLIRILGDRFSAGVKIAVLETLALLLAKVGAQLKPFLPQLQTTFVKSLTDPNRQVRLKAASALGHLIVIHTRPDPLFTELHTSIKNAEDSSVRETTLQALRGVITPAGDKMTEAIRKTVVSTLQGMLGHAEDNTRSAAAGCLGAISRWLPAPELEAVVSESLLNDDPSLDWTVRHGRSAALSVILKEAPAVIYRPEWREKLHKILLAYLAADRVPLATNSIRAIGFLLSHLVESGTAIPAALPQPFAKSLNHSSNEVKQLVAQVSQYLARRSDSMLPADLLRFLLPQLVNGTKEKNTAVRAACESALVAVLRLRRGDDTQQQCINLLDPGARESLTEVINKVLRKMLQQPEARDEELDATIVS